MTHIKPCPFCGHVGLDFSDGSTYRWGLASCSGCGATAGETRREYPDQGKWHEAAISEWNTRQAIATEESSATQEPMAWPCLIVEADFDKNTVTLAMKCENYIVGAGQYWLSAHPQPKAEQKPKREPLTDEQFLELLLRKGSTELVGYSTFVSNSIQMQGRTGLLQGAKLLKEFVEAAHGIKG